MSSNEIARHFTQAAARGLSYEARIQRSDLRTALDDTVRALRALLEAGVDSAFLDDTVAGLIDAIENADAALLKDIDNAREYAEDIDLLEARELLGEIRS